MVRGQGSSSSKSKRDERARRSEELEDDDDEVEVPVMSDEEKMRRVRKKLGCAQLPTQLKKLRACMICSLIKNDADFADEGCDNCEKFLKVAGVRESIFEYTSANFEGMIAMINPEESWVAKWQRLMPLKPGTYAISVAGEVGKDMKKDMEDDGITFFSRDKRYKDKKPDSKDENGDEGSSRRMRRAKRRTQTPVVDLDSGDISDNEAEDSAEVQDESEDTPVAQSPSPVTESEDATVGDANANDSEEMGEQDEQMDDTESVVSGFEDLPLEVTMNTVKQELDGAWNDDTATVIRGEFSQPPSSNRYIPQITKIKLPVLPPQSTVSCASYRSGRQYASSSEDEDQENDDSVVVVS